ncbi:MAG TPA: alpha/beta hydrolase-fold protein [Cellvibrio sp.]|nr:alpha/beta hydrolase-fold protein [Cellvibrio sp.]
MFRKIIMTVLCIIIVSCATTKNLPDKKQPHTPQTLNGMAIEIAIKNIHSDVIPKTMLREGGHVVFYFDDNELFFDARERSGWHFAADYLIEKATNDSLIITTKVPATGQRSRLPLLKQTLVFNTPDSGTVTVEEFDKGKLMYTFSGDFSLRQKTFALIQQEMINTVYTFEIGHANGIAAQNGLTAGTKIEARFFNNKTIKFTVNNKEFFSENNTIEQTDLSRLTMRGTLTQHNIPYEISMDYLEYRMGEFSIHLDNGKSQVSGKFDSYRFNPVTPVVLKGSLVKGQTFASTVTGITYPYEVYLPPGYEQSTKRYPVVYTSDGQWQKEYSFAIDAHNKDVILVSIEQGPDNRRMTDYLPPGAINYSKFLKAEFIPFIEAHYRTNEIRTFTGQSAGGALGGVLIAQESGHQPYFKNYILADSAFWALTPEIVAMEEAHYQQNKQLPINILLSSTWQGNGAVTLDYENRFRARHYQGLTLINKTFSLSHEEMATPTFLEFLDYVDK